MRKKKLIRENERLKTRLNVASKLPFEAISNEEAKYQDILIKGGYHNFMDDFSRREVVLNDAIGERVTLGFLKHIFEKLPKFCPNDEIQSEYIMEDVREALDTLNLKPKFISIGVNAVCNGWCLVLWEINNMALKCKIFGYEECHPRYWIRFTQPALVNLISHYRAIYVPRPAGMEALYHTMMEERYLLRPNMENFQHLTRIDRNYGFGFSRIQPIWDAITKLRERSDSDHFLKSNFMEARYPQSWAANKKAKKFIEKVRRANRRRGIAIEAVTDPQTNQDTGLPSVQYRPWGQGPQGQQFDNNKGGAYLDGEWLRLLVNLGYSQEWAVGMAGGSSGRESGAINLTRDDRADIAEFAILEPIYKEVLKKLAELGVMGQIGISQESIDLLLSKKYKIVSWLTWEFNDRAALQQQQLTDQMEMQKDQSDNKNTYEKKNNSFRKNRWVTIDGGTEDARHVWIGKGPAPNRKGSISLEEWHDREMEKIAKSLDFRGPKKRLDKIRESYDTLNLENEEFDKVMFKLYNNLYKKKVKSYTKDFQDFRDRRFSELLDKKIAAEKKRIKEINKDPVKSKQAKERYKTSELRQYSLMKRLDNLGYVYDTKTLPDRMMHLEDDEIISDIYEEMQQINQDYGAGEVNWEAIDELNRNYEMEKWAYLQQMEDEKYGLKNNSARVIRYNSMIESILYYSIKFNKAMPMLPVMSSWIKRIGFEDNMLFMETHDEDGEGGYKYQKPREDADDQYYSWADSDSKGGYWWDHFADRDPPWQRIMSFPENLEGGYGEGFDWTESEATQEYKIVGEEEKGIIGAGYTREPFRAKFPEEHPEEEFYGDDAYDDEDEIELEEAQPPSWFKFNPTQEDKWAFSKVKAGPGRKRGPGRKDPGHISRKTEREMNPYGTKSPYPITYNEKFKAILNSASALRRFALGISTDHLPEGWHMRTDTPYRIKELVQELGNFSVRVNRVSMGNSVKAGHPYNYGGEDEFICPRDYKKNIGKKVPLGIYHNLEEPGSADLPEWQIIGTHEVLGWDDDLGQEIARNEYNEKLIEEFFKKHNEKNWIKPYLEAGQEPAISGAYTCRVKKYNGKNFQIEIDLRSMSFVPEGNCPWDICNFKPVLEIEKEVII